MSNEIHPLESRGHPTASQLPGQRCGDEPPPPDPPPRRWLRWAAAALERAERRITENFRVPPGGG